MRDEDRIEPTLLPEGAQVPAPRISRGSVTISPPIEVRSAALLIGLGVALGIIRLHWTPQWTWTHWWAPYVGSLLYALIAWGSASSITKARHWVKWVFVVTGAWGPIGLWFYPETISPGFSGMVQIVQMALISVAAALLLLPISRRFFERGS